MQARAVAFAPGWPEWVAGRPFFLVAALETVRDEEQQFDDRGEPATLEDFGVTDDFGDYCHASAAEIRREKEKARQLRNSQWWKNRRAEGICHYCKRKFPPRELTMDHIVPISRGGKSTKGNIVPCCKECNSRKKYHLPLEMQGGAPPNRQ